MRAATEMSTEERIPCQSTFDFVDGHISKFSRVDHAEDVMRRHLPAGRLLLWRLAGRRGGRRMTATYARRSL